jgi:hypothetical protein
MNKYIKGALTTGILSLMLYFYYYDSLLGGAQWANEGYSIAFSFIVVWLIAFTATSGFFYYSKRN